MAETKCIPGVGLRLRDSIGTRAGEGVGLGALGVPGVQSAGEVIKMEQKKFTRTQVSGKPGRKRGRFRHNLRQLHPRQRHVKKII